MSTYPRRLCDQRRARMLPSESAERPDLKKAKAWWSSSWNAGSSNPAVSQLLRVLSFHKLLRTLNGLRKQGRYYDTGESGETYDAEMEAAASMEI
jgi:hypothetical protein